jgi:AcrR family transcriptional regulator
MAIPQTSVRRSRERELVAATRALFDERGVLDAPVEEIAKAVGIARGLIYRQFSSKEELFVLTVTDYLDELAGVLADATARHRKPAARLEALALAYARYCVRYPAFLDCSLSLMHRPARDLRDSVSDSVYLRLGQAMARCIDQLTVLLRAGIDAGVFAVEDPEYTANFMWTQVLGAMHLARIGVGVRQLAPGIPGLFEVDAERVVASCVSTTLSLARADSTDV